MKRPLVLLIRDGWGHSTKKEKNAVYEARPENAIKLTNEYPHTLLSASGEDVGLPEGYQGNSEVGHMTIGSGRILFQSLVRINRSIKDGSFFLNPSFVDAVEKCRNNGSNLHIIGLLQTEGVHAHMDHLFALLDLCKKKNFRDVCIHVITDGRDAPVKKAMENVRKLKKKMDDVGFGEICTVSGRYYTMDRDKRWDRTRKAYECIVSGKSPGEFTDAMNALKESYSGGVTDEFVVPVKRKGYGGINKKDSVIFYNFRTDRTRQLTRAMVEKRFDGWKRKPLDVFFVAMTQYYTPMNARVAFSEESTSNILGEVLSRKGLRQLRISETEKYAHVTFFFNAQKEKPFRGEERVMIPSPKVDTYDKKPEMSVYEIKERLCSELDKGKHDMVVVNLVNGDMVGHTNVHDACLKAVKSVDDCVGQITVKVLEKKGTVMIFADHGNIEDQSGDFGTSHTLNPVPLILVSSRKDMMNVKLRKGGLSDIAPTALDILGIEKPPEMTGESLIVR